MKQGRAGTVWHTDPASAGPSPVVGDVVGGHYRVDAVLAEGGMAVVYRATNTATGKACALKILHAQLGLRPEFVELFAKEARVTTLIGENEHIINVFDAGVDAERGIPFIVMELCEGETLAQALERGPLPRGLCVTLLEQLARALEQAHRAGVVHRDLKPSNLFVTSDREGRPILKVMDFGIAKVLEGEAVRTATHIGTPAYNAPEQMGSSTRRLAAKQGIVIAPSVSPATDVWAIGLIAYEMLTGEMHGQYWGVETLSELPMKVAFEEHMPATERAGAGAALLPEGFDEWFERCLRKNADERFPTAGDAIGELLCLLDGRAAAVEEVETSEEQVQNAETRLFRPGPPPMPRAASPVSAQPPSARPSSRPSARPSSRPSRPSSRPEGGRRGTAPQAPVGVAGGTADAEPARAHLEQPQTPSARPIVRAAGATP
ncbi:MAG: serine/threonine protein kinase, partial [Myxococcales bacterium]|nr:serine/threonine protein kinase [Myxococcales bacterium]